MRNREYTSIEEIEAAYPDPGNETQKQRTTRLNTIRQAKSRLIKREQRRLAAGSSQVQTQQSQAGSSQMQTRSQTAANIVATQIQTRSRTAARGHPKHQHGLVQLQVIHYEKNDQEQN